MTITAEKAGIPSVTLAVTDFVSSSKATGRAAGLPDIRVAAYPGAIAIHPSEEIEKNIRDLVFPQILQLLGQQSSPSAATAASKAKIDESVVCEGSFEEVNEFFYDKGWSDGSPIVPPTAEKVAAFLKYTKRAPGDVIGLLHPSLRPATIHSIAVNAVMAGCLPEHMPVLIAVVEAIADPRFHLEDAGSSAGWAPIIVLNGPVIKRLGFNHGTGVLRVGNRANTSVGRFLRLYLRNIAGHIPGQGDMATFGRPNLPVLAEAEDDNPWEPLSVARGFAPGESVVTVNSVGCMSFQITVVATTPQDILANITAKLQQVLLAGDGCIMIKGPEQAPMLVMSPVIARTLASGGYSRRDLQQYIYAHSKVPARIFDHWLYLQGVPDACTSVKQGKLPAHFAESDDPERLLPLYHAPEELQIIVSGTPERNRFFVTQNIAVQGLATSRRIDMDTLA